MTDLELGDDSPKEELSRFLYVGKAYPVYHPGNLFAHNYFLADNVKCIAELANDPNEKTQLVPVEMITKAFESNLVPHPETLIFALAFCCKQFFSESLRHAAYALVGKICSSPEHFILFIKFTSQISREGVAKDKPNCGWGHGLRKAVNSWYLSKEPLELAKCVTRCRGRHGWKHKDIVKLSHPHPFSPEMEAILKYIMHGLEETKKSFGDNPDVKRLIDYIEKVEEFKHCVDEVEAAGLLEKHGFTLDHVPGHMLKSAEVWNSLIPSMDLHTLLNNLQRIHNIGLLKPDAPAVEKIIDEITNKERLSRDNIHPIFVYITLKNYENSGKPLSYEKRKMKEQARKPFPPPPKPNPKILNALHESFDLSITNLKPTGLRYMVTINANEAMWETRTWRSGNVNGAEAGFLIAYALSSCEKDVTLAAFDAASGLYNFHLNRAPNFPSVMRGFPFLPNHIVHSSRPILRALKSDDSSSYDVFINVLDQIMDYDDCNEAFQNYIRSKNVPHAKLINCVVCSSKTYQGNICKNQVGNILTIYGFDATVPTVIEAFSKSLF